MRISLLIIVVFTASLASAQETWSLERCINEARRKSPDVMIAQLAARSAQIDHTGACNSRLPNINAQTNLGGQFGYTVDPTTYSFVNSSVGFHSLGLNAGIPLYAGGSINHTIHQAKNDYKAAEAEAQAVTNNLALAVAQAYLQVLLFEEQLAVSRKRLDLSQQNLVRTDRLISAGSLPQNARLDILAQIARDEQAVVNTNNSLESAWVQLKNLMLVEPDTPMRLEKPTYLTPPDVNPDNFGLKLIYNAALSSQPQILAADLRLRSAQSGIEAARASLRPTVSLFFGLNTNYSSLGRRLDSIGFVYREQTLLINGQNIVAGFQQPQAFTSSNPYWNQLTNNLGQQAGISIQIPIFAQGRNRLNVERAKLVAQQRQAEIERTRQQLKTDIQSAIVNARAARESLNAAQKTYDALSATYQNSERRFQAGSTNTFELVTSRNNLDVAETNLIIARYEYLFRVKIVEFYQGKTLRL